MDFWNSRHGKTNNRTETSRRTTFAKWCKNSSTPKQQDNVNINKITTEALAIVSDFFFK